MTTDTTQAPAPDDATGTGDESAWNWRTETLYGAVAGAGVLAAFCVALLSGMPETAAYVIVGLVCLWLATIGADRAVKRIRASK